MKETLFGTAVLMGYYGLTLGALPIALRAWTPLPHEVVRKGQHVAYALSVFLLLGLFHTWYLAVAAASLLVVVAYPALAVWERHASYRHLLTDRTHAGGELRAQMLLVQATFAVLIAVFWGGFGPAWRPLIAAAAMVWGFGDAAAALVGRALGRHRIAHRAVPEPKSVEGSLAMAVTAAGATFATLLWYGGHAWWVSLVAAVVVAPVAATVETFSRGGLDTLTVPLSAAAALFPWLLLTAAVGW
jgi:dolichol kinase